ncbi:hypothetical protein BF49_4310 [Bradyrhizobium sp.]|nr:hypothetical protein BF49_4310 [Bradyrhizobium sp.]
MAKLVRLWKSIDGADYRISARRSLSERLVLRDARFAVSSG